jgi:purine-binding chemotaxis protein CheW
MADLVAPGRNDAHRGIKLRGPRVEYLAFRLGADTYAVPIGEVREILKLPPVTEVPRAPPEIVGLLVTVMSLRARLRLQAPYDLSRKGRILLAMGAHEEVIGLYVDEVLQVYRLAESEIEVAASVLGGRLGDYIVGIGRPEGALLTLLDLRPILGRTDPAARDAT